MLTPQQIQDISFEKALFGGYDMDSVDDILEPLTEDYVTLYKENSVLKSKMRILVEKLEEYRKQEASMQNALLAAQKTCDQMVADAEKKCAQMLHEAEDAASAKTNNVDALVGEEQERLDAAKAATSQFLDGMEKRLKRQLELIDELRRETPLTPSQPEEPERVHRFTPPVEPQTPVLTPKEQPKEPSHNRAYDYEAEQSHPSAEEKADALIEEIGQQIEQSLSGSTLGDIAQEDHSGDTRKLDTLHGFPVSKNLKICSSGGITTRKSGKNLCTFVPKSNTDQATKGTDLRTPRVQKAAGGCKADARCRASPPSFSPEGPCACVRGDGLRPLSRPKRPRSGGTGVVPQSTPLSLDETEAFPISTRKTNCHGGIYGL